MASKKDVAISENIETELAPDVSFSGLAEHAFVIESAQLEKDKNSLIGVPFVITRVSYRATELGDYVSVEAVIGDLPALENAARRLRIPVDEFLLKIPFIPEERIVFNDGSTGIRRQLTHLLHIADFIKVSDEELMIQEGDSAFDKPWPEWLAFAQASGKEGALYPDFTKSLDQKRPFAILVKGGLRVSQYDYLGQPAETFYLA